MCPLVSLPCGIMVGYETKKLYSAKWHQRDPSPSENLHVDERISSENEPINHMVSSSKWIGVASRITFVRIRARFKYNRPRSCPDNRSQPQGRKLKRSPHRLGLCFLVWCPRAGFLLRLHQLSASVLNLETVLYTSVISTAVPRES